MTYYRSPDFTPIDELARYGEDHTDPLVRKMGLIVSVVAARLHGDKKQSIAEWLDDSDVTLNELQSDLDSAMQEIEESANKLNEANITIKSLRHDLSFDRHVRERQYLKAELFDADEELRKARKRANDLEHANAILTKNLKELQSKYDTWLAIAT